MNHVLRTGALAVALGALGLSGCKLDPPDLGPEFSVGIVQVFAATDGQGGYVARPRAEFFNARGFAFPDSRSMADSCFARPFTTPLPPRSAPYMSGGPHVQLDVGGENYLLLPDDDGERIVYELPDGGSIPVVPGQVLTFTVPGDVDGFPASVISSLIGPATDAVSEIPSVPETGESIPVIWSPVGDDSAKVELSLRYAAPGTTALNSQILCDWPDNGQNTVRSDLLTGWREAGSIQQIEFTRYRTKIANIEDATLFLVAAFTSFVTPTVE